MSEPENPMPFTNQPTPCTWQSTAGCADCPSKGALMCRFEPKDMLGFFMIILPFGITVVAGTIRAGYGWYLFLWLAYMLFFFFVWEARVLCSHCPFWAEEGRTLHCHANYGVLKLWKYPTRAIEQIRAGTVHHRRLALGLFSLHFPFIRP